MRDEISYRIRRLPAGMSGGRAPDFALAVYGGAFDPPHPGHESV
ncbi:nicotinate-nicotinamide nucleotide adenylyltransferase, partial [Pseudomonas aeruginosa]|nr:nicotinate-nicotinamide nucleotide adenylyltransferase [Pseudomonas aeruginosa]